MESFENHYNRSSAVFQLFQNGSFDTSILPIRALLYYSDLRAIRKIEFVWTGGGNYLNNLGPVLIHGFNS